MLPLLDMLVAMCKGGSGKGEERWQYVLVMKMRSLLLGESRSKLWAGGERFVWVLSQRR